MNALYYLNKIVGIAFAVGLTAFVGYRAYLWRNDVAAEAGKRLEQRLKQMSEDPRYQLPTSEIKWPEVKFSVETMQGFNAGLLGNDASQR
jgi:hypothetical protein